MKKKINIKSSLEKLVKSLGLSNLNPIIVVQDISKDCGCSKNVDDNSDCRNAEPVLKNTVPTGSEYIKDENGKIIYNPEYYYPDCNSAISVTPERTGDGYAPIQRDRSELDPGMGYAPNTKTPSEVLGESQEKSVNDYILDFAENDPTFLNLNNSIVEFVKERDVSYDGLDVEEYVPKTYKEDTNPFHIDFWNL